MYHPNDTIGPYTLLRRLGQGSFGVVWLARDSSSIVREQVALKLPLGEEIDSEKMRQEAVVWLKASGHPNVLPVIDARVYEDQIAIVTEYLPDGTLGQRLEMNDGKAPTVEWAVAVTTGILSGLEHLHGLKMVHRDLKPSNVLLDGNVPRLTDFGLARILRSSARNRASDGVGTVPYTAPEVFRGSFSEQSDIWSVGVMLYQMLAGVLPFPQEHHAEIMYAICSTSPRPLPDTVPASVRDVVDCALDKDIKRRFPTARAMRDALTPHPASDLLNKSMLVVPAIEATLQISKAAAVRPLALATDSASPAVELEPVHREALPGPVMASPNALLVAHEDKLPLSSTYADRRDSRQQSVPVSALVALVALIAVAGGSAYFWARSHHAAPPHPATTDQQPSKLPPLPSTMNNAPTSVPDITKPVIGGTPQAQASHSGTSPDHPERRVPILSAHRTRMDPNRRIVPVAKTGHRLHTGTARHTLKKTSPPSIHPKKRTSSVTSSQPSGEGDIGR